MNTNNSEQQEIHKKEALSHYSITFWVILQAAAVFLFATVTEYHHEVKTPANASNYYFSQAKSPVDMYYAQFQDVNIMMFIGFGFLMTFLHKYWFGSLGLTFWIVTLIAQWYLLIGHFFECLIHKEWEVAHINIEKLVFALYCTASILISFGALLGKCSINQFTAIAFLELIVYSLNESILVIKTKTKDIGGSMLIHTFGAYFGLACSRAFMSAKEVQPSLRNATPTKTSDLFAMIGSIYLFIFWPSFNCALASEAAARHRTVMNTTYSIATSCVVSYILSKLFNKLDIQNATLAGGVAVGASADIINSNYPALIIGFLAGTISICGYRFLLPILESKIGLHDTCGVHNLHGMTGVIGAIYSIIMVVVYYDDIYAPVHDEDSKGKKVTRQLYGLLITLGTAFILLLSKDFLFLGDQQVDFSQEYFQIKQFSHQMISSIKIQRIGMKLKMKMEKSILIMNDQMFQFQIQQIISIFYLYARLQK